MGASWHGRISAIRHPVTESPDASECCRLFSCLSSLSSCNRQHHQQHQHQHPHQHPGSQHVCIGDVARIVRRAQRRQRQRAQLALSTPTVKIEVTQTQPDPKHVQIETPDRTPAGTPPPGESRLRQRFRSVRDELGKSMEDISVRIRNKGDGNYKVCFRRGRR